jgi:hypothetical protein
LKVSIQEHITTKTIIMATTKQDMQTRCDELFKMIQDRAQRQADEIKELKERITTHEDIDEMEIIIKGTGCDSLKELAEQNKKLKDDLEELQSDKDDVEEECERWEAEADRTSELETIAWIDFYGEKEVIDDIKPYRFRDDILSMKKELKELKENELTDENAIQHVYDHTDEFDDWVKGSTIYEELEEEKDKLQEQLEEKEKEARVFRHRSWAVESRDFEKLKEENKKIKIGTMSLVADLEADKKKLREDLIACRHHTNMMLDLIKTADTPEKIKMLQDMPQRFDEPK